MRTIAFVVCAAALAVFASCSSAPRARDAVLLTIDTLRADRLGCQGNPLVRTPALDRFFRGATQFSNAFSPAPTTLVSHASMLTGLWPSEHGIPRNGWPLAEGIATLPAQLDAKRFARGAFVSSAALDPRFGLDRGFEVYDCETTRDVARDQAWRSADETCSRALSWWRAEAGRRRFLFLHVFEPHFPYEPERLDLSTYESAAATTAADPAAGSMEFLFALWENAALFTPDVREHLLAMYHAEITGLDRRLRPVLDEFADSGALVVVTADHGESLGERGLNFKHGPNVFPGDVHVPLAIRGTPPFAPGLSDAFVRGIDLAPTILAALGVVAAPALVSDAVDLASRARGGADLPAFSEASMPWNVERPGEYPNREKQRALRTRERALVATPWAGTEEWFDRARDPGEEEPLASPGGDDAARLERDLAAWGDRGAPREPPTGISPELVEQLHGLGYTGR